MKLSTLILLPLVAACPGMDRAASQLQKLPRRALGDPLGPEDSYEMIGDLVSPGATTTVGKNIKAILLGTTTPYSDEAFPILSQAACLLPNADKCCVWKIISLDFQTKFRGLSGRCNGLARGAVRLGFHDAGAWSKTAGYGGADGSIVLSNEMTRPENRGLEEIVAVMKGMYSTYKAFGISMADLIQMGATTATVVCPLGPRIRSFVGRKDNPKANVDGLLRDVFASADSLIKLFEDKTIRAHGLAALVGAHTTSQQRFVNISRATDPQDSTPGVWDVKFYPETTGTAPKRVFKFPSDVVLSTHPKIASEWQSFSSAGGQEHWNEDFAKEYVRLSLLGVNNINQLTECTKVLPAATKVFVNPDQAAIDKYLNSLTMAANLVQQIGNSLRDGGIIAALLAALGL